ncbi:MAG: Sec-independent protein translocase subunit TatA/TatB [Acidimicrobiia bacterium]
MPQIGPAEILVVLVVGLLVFGANRVPEAGRQIGRGLREVRRLRDAVTDELHWARHDHDERPAEDDTTSVADAPLSAPR